MTALATIPAAPSFDTWHPIASIPTARLDRDVTLWAGRLVVGTWCDGWFDPVGRPLANVTHYAEIEGPRS